MHSLFCSSYKYEIEHYPFTYFNRSFPSQQQFEALNVVRQTAVVQGCATFTCLLVQIATIEVEERRGKLMKIEQERTLNQ